MQFLSAGRYVANIVDGKVTRWRKAEPLKAGQNETEANFAHPMAKESGSPRRVKISPLSASPGG